MLKTIVKYIIHNARINKAMAQARRRTKPRRRMRNDTHIIMPRRIGYTIARQQAAMMRDIDGRDI